MSKRLKISRTTATNFIKKVRISMASSASYPSQPKQGSSNDSKKEVDNCS